MGCIPFANFHFQVGVTVMGFAEHFGHCFVLIQRLELAGQVLKKKLVSLKRLLPNSLIEGSTGFI